PRILNQPARWRFSNLKKTRQPRASSNAAEAMTGVRSMRPASLSAAAPTSASVRRESAAIARRLSQNPQARINPSVILPASARSPGRMRTPFRLLTVLASVLIAPGCSLISVDLTPRIKPIEERTVEGSGRAKIVLTDLAGFLSEEGQSQTLVIGAPSPRVGLLVRFREELK